MPVTCQPSRASGTALRPAPQPMSSACESPPRRSSRTANAIRTAFGGDCATPATVPAALHVEPARGSVGRDMMTASTMTQTTPPAEVLFLRSLVTPTEQGIASRVLAKTTGGNLTLFAFDSGQGLTEHTSPFEALVLVLEGSLTLTIGGTAVRATPGTIVRMPADIPHALDAPEACRVLLIML